MLLVDESAEVSDAGSVRSLAGSVGEGAVQGKGRRGGKKTRGSRRGKGGKGVLAVGGGGGGDGDASASKGEAGTPV